MNELAVWHETCISQEQFKVRHAALVTLVVVLKHLMKSNFGEEGFILAHSSRGYGPPWWGRYGGRKVG